MVQSNIVQPLPEFVVNGTSFCFPKNEPQRHPVSHPMGSSMSLPDCEFEYKNLNINKGVRKAPEPL